MLLCVCGGRADISKFSTSSAGSTVKVQTLKWPSAETCCLQHGLTDKLRQEDNEERRDQVIDALDVAAGGVPDGPDEEDSLKHLQEAHRVVVWKKHLASERRILWLHDCCPVRTGTGTGG